MTFQTALSLGVEAEVRSYCRKIEITPSEGSEPNRRSARSRIRWNQGGGKRAFCAPTSSGT
jgi:hypothetical protein